MRKSWKDKGLRKVCIPIVETTVGKAFGAIEKANRVADLIELRLDYLKKVKMERIFNRVEKPFIVTNRGREEGGRYKGDERKRLNILMEAIDLEAHYVDVEMKSEPSLLQSLIRNKRRTKLILSFHDFQKTPPLNELQNLFDSMIQMGADIVKIVTFANSWEDNLQTLSLIPYGKEKGREIVAFCMGEKGKISRIFAPSLGAAWTYASLNNAKTSAPGQLTVQEMNHIWERLR